MEPEDLQFFTLSLFTKLLDKLKSYSCGLQNDFFFFLNEGLLCIMQGTTVSPLSCKGKKDKLTPFQGKYSVLVKGQE